jgi:SAM-dependent methyltransferase
MTTQTNHRFFAAVYDPVSRLADRAGLAERRRRLLSEARGRVLEVGGGTGLNLPHYRDVDEVVVLEPDEAMRRRLDARLPTATVPVEVQSMAIEDAPFPDGSFDTVVTTLVLCGVPDLAVALARIRGLLKPDGRLLFLEHVAAAGARHGLQRLANPVWRRVNAGCRLDRDTTAAMRAAGFVITDCERHKMFGDPFTGLTVQGVARPRAQEQAA